MTEFGSQLNGRDPHTDVSENHSKNQSGVICPVLEVERGKMSNFVVREYFRLLDKLGVKLDLFSKKK